MFISAGWGAFERNLSSADKQSQSLRQPLHKDCDVYQFQNAQSHVLFFWFCKRLAFTAKSIWHLFSRGQSPFHILPPCKLAEWPWYRVPVKENDTKNSHHWGSQVARNSRASNHGDLRIKKYSVEMKPRMTTPIKPLIFKICDDLLFKSGCVFCSSGLQL